MRLQLLPVVAAALCLGQAVRANDIEPGKEKYTATPLPAAFKLDGKLTEWSGVPVLADPKFSIPKGSGTGGTLVLFEEYNGGKWTGPDDQTSAVQVAYDADNVYFGFVVTDDYHENSANSAWNGDSVQLMIASADRSKQVALYNYALGGIEGELGEVIVMHEATPPDIGDALTEAVITRDAATKKTTYEIKLPKATLGLTELKAGVKFGLGMAINDGDQDTPGQKGWGGLGAHSIVFGKTPGETAEVTLGSNEPTIEVLGVGTESLLGSDLTDPENNGDETLGPTDPSWNWKSINSNIEPAFEGGEFSFNIFDNKVGGGNDKWCCDDPSETNPYWVSVEFPNPVSLTHFTITSGNDSPDRDPLKFEIQGSNDGASFTPIYHRDSATDLWTERNQVIKFTLPSAAPLYRYLRYYVTFTPGTLHQINEIEYFGNIGTADKAFLSAINPTLDSFSFRANDSGASVVDPASGKLTIDGVAIPVTGVRTGGAVDYAYKSPTVYLPGSEHTYAVQVKDGLGNTISSEGTFKTENYLLLTAAEKVAADTSKPGFIWNVHQNNAFGANDNVRPLDQLAGRLGVNQADKDAAGIAIGAGTPGANANMPIRFEIETVINLDQAAGSNGDFTPDDQMPGIPGLGEAGQTDGIAGEILTYIELPVGQHTFIVNSDDGFFTTAGNYRDVFQAKKGGEFSGGRGASDTAYKVVVTEAGIYPFRTVWEEGGGGANIEWKTVKADGTKVLINDVANGGFKAYRASSAATPTAVTAVSPVPNANQVSPSANITATIEEGSTTVDTASVKLKVDGSDVVATVTKVGKVVSVSYDPATDFPANSTHSATLSFTAGAARSDTWSFTVPPITRDTTSGKPGFIVAGAKHTDDKGGHTGAAGDYGMDMGVGGLGTVYVDNISFVNAATADDTLTVSFFQKLHGVKDGSGFWMNSPSSNNGTRGFQAHTPWSDGSIYFDTSGCCTADTQRINLNIDQFSGYTGDATWWNSWHHFAFVKDGATKTIYIDGIQFHSGGGDPLPTDFTTMVIGGGPAAGDNRTSGILDDFAIFNAALTEAQIKTLVSGTAPSAVSGNPGLLAHWNFNDKPTAPVDGPKLAVTRSGNSVTVTSTPQPMAAGFVLQTATSVTGPWTTVAGQNTPFTATVGAGNVFLRAVKP